MEPIWVPHLIADLEQNFWYWSQFGTPHLEAKQIWGTLSWIQSEVQIRETICGWQIAVPFLGDNL